MTSGTEMKTILIIEDDPSIMTFASRVLELEGYHILKASNAEKGLVLVAKDHVDLILLDIMLPDPDGWEVLSKIKNNPQVSSVPVIVFSAAVESAKQERALKMGAVEFLEKPLSSMKLRETIHETLQTEG